MRYETGRFDLLPWMQAGCLLLAMSLMVLCFMLPRTTGMEEALLMGSGIGSLLVLLFPLFFRRQVDLFEPIHFVALTTFFGTTLRSFYISLFDNENIRELLLMGHARDSLLKGAAVILIGLMLLSAGYAVRSPAFDLMKFRVFRKHVWDSRRFLVAIAFLSATGTAGTILYLKKMGIEEIVLGNISAKHTLVLAEAEYQSSVLGYYRWAASLIQPAFYLMLAWFASSKRRLLSPLGGIVILFGILAAVFPFINSQRTEFAMVPVTALVIWHHLRKAIRIRQILIAVLLLLLSAFVMTSLRMRAATLEEILDFFSAEKITETFAGNRNFLGIDKTSFIINHVPEKYEFQYGKTFFLWLAAPIPRTVWKEKPVISMGQIVIDEIYFPEKEASQGGGVPPGLIAELYINFGYFGIPLGMFLFGFFLKFVYESFRGLLVWNKNALLCYVAIMIPFAFYLPGGNFGSVIVSTLRNIIPFILVLGVIGKQDKQNGSPA